MVRSPLPPDSCERRAQRAHAHDDGPRDYGRAFTIGIVLQTAFVLSEVVVGLASSSLAVIADAGHNLSDVLALVLAWVATRLVKRRASKGRTYGWKSASILAALVNALSLIFVNGAVAWEALGRFRNPTHVAALPVIVVSLAGVLVNGVSAWLFARGSKADINARAAFLHLASDAAVAAGVAVTGVLIYFTGLTWLDPAASLIVSALVLLSTLSLLRRAVDLAMHAVPPGIDEEKMRDWLASRSGIVAVHDLHVWAMSTTENAMTAHVVMRRMPMGADACELDAALRKAFPVHHVTIQIDPEGSACALEPDYVM